ncbi:MAG: HDOD domain-containing protein, partial [Candidatus Magnetoovum sp. WYHC-5]|nr:HDOD domain-containing protein [Candidatus Magnetoovum sp. WYHC-5]
EGMVAKTVEKVNLKRQERQLVTVMLTDFVGSTTFAERVGDVESRIVFKRQNAMIEGVVKKSGGVFVKSVGEATLSYFRDAQKALGTAIDIQKEMESFNNTHKLKFPLHVRIGMHTGEVLIESNDVFGDVVNVAARFETLAEAGDIYLSDITYHSLSASNTIMCTFVRTTQLKGKKDTFNIYKANYKGETLDFGGDFIDFLGGSGSGSAMDAMELPEAGYESKKRDTIDRLHLRMNRNSDFPAFTRTINVFSKLPAKADFDEISIADLTNNVLNDFALTNKLLKMVNTAFYAQYGGKVSTVSRAVMLVGFKQVRNLALSLLLLEQMQDKNIAEELRNLIINSYVSGVIAKDLAKRVGNLNEEEAFICSIFTDLGRTLVAFYLPEDYREVAELMVTGDVDIDDGSRQVLGISYEDLGIAIAREWNIPDVIIDSMQKLKVAKAVRPMSENDRLRHIATFSYSLCAILVDDKKDQKTKEKDVKVLKRKYEDSFIITDNDVSKLIGALIVDLDTYSKVFTTKLSQEPFFIRISKYLENSAEYTTEQDKPVVSENKLDEGMQEHEDIIVTDKKGVIETKQVVYTSLDDILQKGVFDVMSSLLEDYTINDILQIILEIIYRGMEFFRTVICIRNARTNVMEARFGFGPDVDKITKDFRFRIEEDADIFNIALRKNTEIVVTNINAPDIKAKIPLWYRRAVNAQTFILLPIVVNSLPIGIIYADKIYSSEIVIPKHQLWYLKTLRMQAILAFKQKI